MTGYEVSFTDYCLVRKTRVNNSKMVLARKLERVSELDALVWMCMNTKTTGAMQKYIQNRVNELFKYDMRARERAGREEELRRALAWLQAYSGEVA